MIEIDANSSEPSMIEKGRWLLEQGDVANAVDCYGRVYDPDTLDETEAREMLIEARAHLSRKRLIEALECFEEALLMGTEVQRRQALEGISEIGRISGALKRLSTDLKKGLRKILGKKRPESVGLALVSDAENVVLITDQALERLPGRFSKSGAILGIPPHLSGARLPLNTDKCIPYANDADVRFILDAAEHLTAPAFTDSE